MRQFRDGVTCLPAQRSAGWTGVKRVLAIDDDPTVAELLRVVLEDAGYAVTVASAVDEASGAFDCVVTDLQGLRAYDLMSAREVVQRLERRFAGTPIVVATAHHQAQRDAAALGPWRVVLKPFDVDQLVGAVRDATAR